MAKIDSTPVSVTAAADLSAKTWYFGKLTSGGLNVCSTLGEHSDGIIGGGTKATMAAGDACDLYVDKIVKVVASAAIAKGDELTPAATGKAVTAATGNVVRAKALEAADAADAIISVLIVSAYTK